MPEQNNLEAATMKWLWELQELTTRMQGSYVASGTLTDDLFFKLRSLTMTYPRRNST